MKDRGGALDFKPWLQSNAALASGVHSTNTSAWHPLLAEGPLWDASGRDGLDGARAEATSSINRRRNRGILCRIDSEAHSALDPTPGPPSAASGGALRAVCALLVPVSLAPAGTGGYAEGWDVILPMGWGSIIMQQVTREEMLLIVSCQKPA